MQFSCESCHATLHIGDEKVKGKRLVVRCKRCGARIQIADPALGPTASGAAPQATSAVLAPVAKAPPKSAPAPREELRPVATDDEHDSDTDDTRAMESDVLEKALQASKRDDPSAAGLAPAATSARPTPAARPAPLAPKPAPAPAPPPESAPALRDPPVWFAMVGGKQTGPMSRATIALKTATDGISGRTYVWKDGMAGWLRGVDVPELASLFAPPPAARPAPAASRPTPPVKPAPTPAPGAAKAAGGKGLRDFSTEDFGALSLETSDAAGLPLNLGSPLNEPGVAGARGGPVALPAAIKVTAPGRPTARPAALAPPPVAAPEPSPAAGQAASDLSPDLSIDGLPRVGQSEPDDEERTNVEALPLGERIHQEGVAQELFSSGEGGSVSATDLAKWASSELGKKPPSGSNLKKASPPLPAPAGQTAAAAPAPRSATQPAASPKSDPLAGVPDAPGLQLPGPADTTGKVLAKSGVHQSRAPLLLAVVFGAVLVIGVLLWALVGGSDKPEAAVAIETARPSVGGSGDASVGQLAAKPEAPAGQGAGAPAGASAARPPAPPRKLAASPDKADKPASEKQAEKLTQEQAEALKNLDNERGVGNHGPKAGSEPAAPEPAKAGTSLTSQDIRKKLVENKGALQSCIDDALKKEPDLRVGKIHIATAIAPSGQVTSTKIDKPKVDGSPLGACLKRATRRIVFPAFDGDAFEVDIPIQVTARE